jgi:hypothetical protein
MFFLNLSLFQFAALFGSVAAVSVALYLLDRSRRKQIVSTLRFWVAAEQPAVAARRRRINQPWSLILQLVSMALLLLAIAQLKFGAPLQAGHDHVIVLDTSAWMAARSGSRSLMDLARQSARQYLRVIASCWFVPIHWPRPPRLSSRTTKWSTPPFSLRSRDRRL